MHPSIEDYFAKLINSYFLSHSLIKAESDEMASNLGYVYRIIIMLCY